MKPNAKSFRWLAVATTAVALCVAAGSVPAAAQSERCVDLYNRVIALYQTAPQSYEYNRMASYYGARCLAGGPSASPGYSGPYQRPYPGY
jgi:hypothetical protein